VQRHCPCFAVGSTVHFRTPLTVSYSNFANNLLASSCDSLRPIIAFGTCFSVLRSSSWPSVPWCCHLPTADWNYFRPISWVLSREVGMGVIMRQIISSVLLVAMCTGSMASVIWVLHFGGFNLMLLAGGCIAAVSTVVLAEEFVEWRSRTRGKVTEASPVKR
jgi:hypothetical protein